jgi:ABC-type multidrug transport system fused ATPase/permease subunit
MKRLLQYALRSRAHLWLLAVTALLGLGLSLFSTMEVFSLGLITSMGNGQAGSTHQGVMGVIQQWLQAHLSISQEIKTVIFLLVGVASMKALFQFGTHYLTELVAIRVSRTLRQAYFEHIQMLPMSFYTRYNIGNLSSRVMGDAGRVANSLNSLLTNYIVTPISLVLTLVWCFYVSWQLSLLVFVGFPVILFPVLVLTSRIRRVSRQIQRNQEAFASVLIDFLAGIQTVKVFVMEKFSLRKYQEQNDRMAHLEAKSARYFNLSRPILHTVGVVCIGGITLYGLQGLGLGVSDVIVFAGLLFLLYDPIKKMADENLQIQKGLVAAERMDEVLCIEPDIQDRADALDIKQIEESIEFDRVWFRYGNDWILRDVSFKVERGECVALVGPTGAGKSTVLQLLPRLYEVDRGQIRIDGRPLDQYTQRSLRETIAVVPQRPFLFVDTVAENIAFGRPFSMEQIEEAARLAQADEFIRQLPQGYQTVLAETGKTLSGGQQQRLAIARALLKQASVLMMDEATSALDGISELKIRQATNALRGQLTQIIVTHRLSALEGVDRIIVIHEGRVVDQGPRHQLLERCQIFRLMWESYHHRLEEQAEPCPV